MPVVSAGLHRQRNGGTGRVAVLRVHGVLLHGDFLHGVGRRHVARLVADADRAAVDLQVVRVVASAADLLPVSGPGEVRLHFARGVALHDRRIQPRQQQRIARHLRQIAHQRAVHRRFQLAGVELDRARLVGYGHGFDDVAGFQRSTVTSARDCSTTFSCTNL